MTDEKKKKIIKWYWILLTAPFLALFILLCIVWAFADIPSIEQLENPDTKLATQVIAQEGEILTTYHIENRTFVAYEDLAPSLVQATVATEDKRFYKHSGVDIPSLARVMFKTLLGRDSSQGGGSTITQQLAKTLYPRGERVGKLKMIWIKPKEWITAIKLEKNYTKEEIVDMYLNAIFFGSNSYGISSAAYQFFGKQPADLLTEESAVLVGMVNKPTRYNPAINPEHALRRRNLVLDRMCSMKYLSKAQRDSLQALPIVLQVRQGDRTTGVGPYFRDMLRTMSASKPKRSSYLYPEDYQADSTLWADDPLYGWLNKNYKSDGTSYDLEVDGLRIYTTINYKMQRYAEEAVAEHLGKDLQPAFWKELRGRRNPPFSSDTDKSVIETTMKQARRWSDRTRMMKASGHTDAQIEASFSKPVKMRVFTWEKPGYRDTTLTPDDSIRYYKSFFRAAFMAIEPGTGHIRAYVGGPDYRYFKYDNVRQGKRQVGSTIKPFLYTEAMESGMTPCDPVLNAPVVIVVNADGETWSPQDTHADGTLVNLNWGLAHSSNSVSAYLMKELGAPSMVSMMRKLGITGFVDPVASLCVGSADLSVYDMVTAYNTYPSGGTYTSPIFVTRIEDSDGNILSQFSDRKREALSQRATGAMIQMMRSVVDAGGTGARLRFRYGLKGEIAGKTGTTNDNSDGWFIGYTPSITAGVWVGAEDRYVRFSSTNLGQGANMALPIWGLWMQKVLKDGTLGISEGDMFPEALKGSYCNTAGEDVTPEKTDLETYYFE